jgi:5-methyltetrahydropteroyltriglutamate--homocysteine methyltransferase
MNNKIPTEQIGSIPRTAKLIEAYEKFELGEIDGHTLSEIALKDTIATIKQLEETGSPCISDGEQCKFSGFASYCLHGAKNIAPDGIEVKFSDIHNRTHSRYLPRLTEGPFRYQQSADEFLEIALKYAHVPVKQAVVSPSLLSLIYPDGGIEDYHREQFIEDVIEQHTNEVRRCLQKGADKVQIDFTEGRLSLKIDPSGELLNSFVELINMGLVQFNEEDRKRIGIHTCPGSDKDAMHSADIDYKYLLPTLFEINAGNFYIAMAMEKHPQKVLRLIKTLIKPHHNRIFVGVIDPTAPTVESPELVRDRVLEAAKYIPVEQLGVSDDCGFSPFIDDFSTSRKLVFDKIRSRVKGTKMAEEILFNQKRIG